MPVFLPNCFKHFNWNNIWIFFFDIPIISNITDTLSLDSNSKTLEIGCGWGGFSSFVAKNYNCSVDAITISKEQYEYASEKIQNEGLSEKVSVIFSDYRDIKKKYWGWIIKLH